MNDTPKEKQATTITQRIGNTLFEVELHFNNSGKETLENKVKRMILQDIKAK